MPSIDERVVSMAFENQVFEQRVSTTLNTLAKLDTAVKNIGSTTGFANVEAAANKVTLQGPMSALDRLRAKLGRSGEGAAEGLGQIDKAGNKVTLEGPAKAVDKVQSKMDHLNAGSTFTDIEKASSRISLEGLTSALDSVTNKFSVLQGAATVALGNIASQAAMKGAAFAKSFAFGPIQQGFQEYQTNLGSIQTILANTSDSGGNLKTVNAALDELNTYSDKTIYNFSEMAKNIGTFTAAGVQLKPATAAIKGIANLAALSGSNSQQASTAMYQLSQAIAAGKVGLQDWNSVVNAGMGGAVFQKALMRTAENMGALKKGAVEIDKATGKATVNGKSFRESITAKPGEQSWLTSDVLTNTLSQFTGDLSDAQLAAQGFNQEQIKAIQNQAKMAQNAATEVKTLPQVFDVAKETIGSGWSATFRTIFGDFEESKKTFTGLSNFLNGFINKSSDARNKVLADWKTLGGRIFLIRGIKAAFDALMAVIEPIKKAFRDIFPPTTGKQLFELTAQFGHLMHQLTIGPETADKLRRIFAGLFAVLDIGWKVVKGVVSVIADLLGVVGQGSGGFLSFVASIGDFLVSIDEALTKGNLLKKFFEVLGGVLQVPLHLISSVAQAIAHLFSGGEGDKAKGFEGALQGVNDKLGPLKGLIDQVVGAWHKLVDIVNQVKTALDPWFSQMTDKLSGVGDVIANAFKGLNVDRILQGLQTGLIAGIFVTLKKQLGGGGALAGIFDGIVKPLKGVNDVLEGFTGQMEAMQSKLHAEALLAIAGAIAVLVAALYVLSTIDGDKLSKALTATAIGLGELIGAMKLLTSGMGKMGALQLPLIAAGLMGLALAMVVLGGAMKIFATMSWTDIAKGMAGIAGALVAIGDGMKVMGGGPAMLAQAAGLILIGIGLNAIAAAVKIFSTMSWEEMARGLVGVLGVLLGIVAAVDFMPPTLPLIGVGLIALGVGLGAIAGAVAKFGEMDIFKLVQGMTAMMLAIGGIGIMLAGIPPTIGLTAAGLLVVGQAMVVTAGAIALLGSLSIGTLVKGIAGLAGALIVLAGGLTLMIVSLPGALALMVAAGALAVLVPVLGLLGTMKWTSIFKGLAAIAAALVTIGIAGLIAAPALIGLGVALIPLGLGMMLVATAAKIFAGAIALMSSEGQKGFSVLLAAITGFIALLPTLVVNFIKGMLSIVDQVAVIAPKVITALDKILTVVIAFIIREAPRLATAITVLISSILQVFIQNTPRLLEAGYKLLKDLLAGIDQHIEEITNKVADIITKFLEALAGKADQLTEAGAKVLAAFIQGIANHINVVVNAVTNMVVQFINALEQGVPRVIHAAEDMMIKFYAAVFDWIPKLIKLGTDVILKLLGGIQNAIPKIKDKALSVARTFLNNLADGLVSLVDIGYKAMIRFMNGMANTIRKNNKSLTDAAWNLASAIVDGLVNGLGSFAHRFIDAAGNLARSALHAITGVFHIGSPSKETFAIGQFVSLGLAQGIARGGAGVDRAMESVGSSVLSTAQSTFGSIPTLLEGMLDMDPIISPVLDLSQVEQEAGRLSSIVKAPTLSTIVSMDQATRISDESQRFKMEAESLTAAPVQTAFHFEQNNYSPDPLSNIEIYRQTNNQLSRLKTLVGV